MRTSGRALPMVARGALALVGFAACGHALAHDAPRSIGVTVGGADRITTVLNRGLLFSEDGGSTWAFLCGQGLDLLDGESPALLYRDDGTLLLASFNGLKHGDPDGCGWAESSDPLGARVVSDLVHDPETPSVWWATTASGGEANGVYRSEDDGTEWAPVGSELEAIFREVRVAPSDRDRIYTTVLRTDSDAGYALRRSEDGGETWMEEPVALSASEERFVLLAVDPDDPDRVLARVDGSDQDRIVTSDDAGATWSTSHAAPDLQSFAISDDGDHVWVGGPGLYRSDDRGASFASIADLEVGCLAFDRDVLWACAGNWRDGFALGTSADLGATFTPVLRLEDVAAGVRCLADAGLGASCDDEWTHWTEEATAWEGGAEPEAGCGCTHGERHPRAALLAALAVAAALRRSASAVPCSWRTDRFSRGTT